MRRSTFGFLIGFFRFALAPIFSLLRLFAVETKPDWRTVLAVDDIVRSEPAATPIRSRFRAFMARALDHSDYRGGVFDPGRCMA